MNQDQSKSDQDVENTSSEGNSTATSTQDSTIDTQEIPVEQQVNAETEAKNQPNAQTQAAVDTNSEPKKSAAIKAIGLMVLILLLGFIAFGLWKSYQPKEIELQGRVEADTIHVSTKVPSRIEEIYVHDGQKVSKDQELVRLFSPEIDAKKQQALAALQSALALQSTAERGSQQENIDSLYANWQSLKAQEALAKTTYQRGANLFKEGVISRQRRDEMQAAALSASQLTEAAYQQYARAKRGSTPQQLSSADAQVQIAQAAVAEANALAAETKLRSPIDGTVSKTYGKVSELVAMGVPVVSIIQDDNLWVSVNVREDLYAQIYKAKSMDGFIPALNQTATFKIKTIDAEGEFATIKTTRQTGGYDIRSFKIHLAPVQPITDLKVGMSVLFKIKEPQ
ncbi:HlyD family efflux transporter periplasmic adaptor subunit [Acinetobacter bohemicus]|uniref:HlyD family secretion protein n=1 Tax=Acinetobacter bohemicus TaxID=1435036 RepID=A0A1I6U8H3_9GAMM|nr:efflux RND transporter periplasmic adaptor subunit [Acinetobacter bohemicus]KAB0653086.1 HlyD family efflux transporter periplasmic adaptor subunit [Acinetobacter bohemicus]SFS97743.1 HlyD family secretion protein [Acinetobacter bohemicus]